MILPCIARCAWICDALCVPYHDAILITGDKAPVLLLNKIQHMNDLATPLLHQLLLLWPHPVKHEDFFPQDSVIVHTMLFF